MSLRITNYTVNRDVAREIKYHRGATELVIPGGIEISVPKTILTDVLNQAELLGIKVKTRTKTKVNRWSFPYDALQIEISDAVVLKKYGEGEYVGDILLRLQAP